MHVCVSERVEEDTDLCMCACVSVGRSWSYFL